MIVHKKKCVFIHINRCAGNSMEDILRPYTKGMYGISRKAFRRPKHISAQEHIEYMGKKKFKSYFSFTFVRNPWDKMLSYFLLQRKYHKEFKYMTFTQWLKSERLVNIKSKRAYVYRKYTNQYDWLTDRKGRLVVDFIGRFENINNDWKYVAKKIGVTTKLPHTNKTKHKHYSLYYDQESIDYVAGLFSKDIEYFGYDFEDMR